MKDENIDSSLAIARSSVKEEVKTYAERRVKLNDTNIKKYRPKDKIYSVGDSEMVGLRLYVRTSGSKIYYYCYKPKNEKNSPLLVSGDILVKRLRASAWLPPITIPTNSPSSSH